MSVNSDTYQSLRSVNTNKM